MTKNEWIPTSVKTPESTEQVLIQYSDKDGRRHFSTGSFDINGEWYRGEADDYCWKLAMRNKVEAWMPLPERYENKLVKAWRMAEVETDEFEAGDVIAIGHYTATCQKSDENGALFFMDQYDDDPQRMNDEDTNEGGYEKSDLRRRINNEESLKDFPEEIRQRMMPFENGDLIRIPTVGEMFEQEEFEGWCEDDGAEQLPLMRLRENRVAYRKNKIEWGWLQNKTADTASNFANVHSHGVATTGSASYVNGVRRVFLLANRTA